MLRDRICFNCGLLKTYRNQWYRHNGKYYCKKCENKLFVNPKWHSVTNPKRLNFKNKFIMLKESPRKGICKLCKRKIGKEIKRTNIHHLHYRINQPLKYTVELCIRCHRKIHAEK